MREREVPALPSDGLDNLLERMQSSGETHSEGVFTISPEKAREKLSQFALLNPRHYVLNLVASAVAAGASRIDVRVKGSEMIFGYDGALLGSDDLETLWNHLLQPRQTALFELGIALNAARTLKPTELSVVSWNGEVGSRLDVRGDRLDVQTLAQPPWDGGRSENCVTVRLSLLSGGARYAFGSPESAILEERALYGPVPITLNGRLLSRTLRLADASTTAAFCRLGETRLPVEAPDLEIATACLVVHDENHALEATLVLAPLPECRKLGLRIVLNGVSFQRENLALEYPFAAAVVCTGDLGKNLSHSDLAEDERYESLLATLNRGIEDLVLQRIACEIPCPMELAHRLGASAPAIAQALRARGNEEGARAVLRWLKELRFLIDMEQAGPWQEICQELTSLRGHPAGDALERRVLNALQQAAGSFLTSGDVSRCAGMWQRITELGGLLMADWTERARERLTLLQVLCGARVEPGNQGHLERRGALLRLLDRYDEVMSSHQERAARAQTLLALEMFAEAETLLQEGLREEPTAELAEAYADLLLYGPVRDAMRNREALVWKERAVQARATDWAFSPYFFREDLIRAGRSAMSWAAWLKYRTVQSFQSADPQPDVRQLEEELTALRGYVRRTPLGTVRAKSLVLAAELKLPPHHPCVEAARVRAVSVLREVGQWKEADELLARGFLLRRIHQLARLGSPAPLP